MSLVNRARTLLAKVEDAAIDNDFDSAREAAEHLRNLAAFTTKHAQPCEAAVHEVANQLGDVEGYPWD